ncbi:2Fe-2S iron-sulfur cluster-binding protein [uncultured Sulfitobacter sp.]|uniref:2Fe-2S iron-sulfur cluster-binding protein n=1 Tax=uncultured Sulfitobacter sp. TaxID=191468 RepID=UPI002609A034|nr:2Fe-2S iron-sulfur cluster-binding protein [uncultured Sulfitobacter sp.]
MNSRRIAGAGLIDRTKPLSFTFDGKPYTGFEGDTLASALLANGVQIMGRSFKYHRPRGVWGAWFDDPNAIFDVKLNGISFPNCPATTTPLEDGMQARAVNAWPSAQFDVKRGLDLFHRFLGAGFYYKTFIWPDWHLFEPSIRKMAGLGSLEGKAPDAFSSDQVSDHCDVLVVGGGAAGLAAARSAAQNGQSVVLVEDHATLGGGLYAMGLDVDGCAPAKWVATQKDAIIAAGGRVLAKTTAIGVYDHMMVALAQDLGFGKAPRLWRMRAGRIIMATGALDRPITFENNDLPGIMSACAAAEYLGRYGVLAGDEITVLSNNTVAQQAAAQLEIAGAKLRYLDAAKVTARGVGHKGITAISYGTSQHRCDTLLASGGLTPIVHLWRHAGGKLAWDAGKAAFLPSAAPDGMTAVGAANGTFDLDHAIAEGTAAGLNKRYEPRPGSYHMAPIWPKPHSKGRQWIDFQHDVTLKDIEIASKENFVSVEHLKRYTTLGMAIDQGKTSNMAGLAAMAALQGKPIPEVGTTTFRPPFVPVSMSLYKGSNSGQLFHPLKRLALEERHRAAGAALGEYGGWLRPGWYGTKPASEAIFDEVSTARNAAAIIDASPLGKIEVMGPDAEAFVNFIYYNTIKTLKSGNIRYGFMLTEQGVVYDDGVIARMDQNRFIISCSSSHVDGVFGMLEAWRQDGNDPDRIFIHDTTQNWPTVTIAGPKAREIVGTLDLGVDLSAQAFPHMSLQTGSFKGAPARIARVSFTGDVSYEISTSIARIEALWDAVNAAGRPLSAGPVGIEALSVLRAEKGYIMVGKDTDGETMPHDLGFSAPRLKKTTAFVGDRGLHTSVANDPNRKQLVGLRIPADTKPLPIGAHIVEESQGKQSSVGFVTSSYHSPTLGHPIALALLAGGATRLGEQVTVWHNSSTRQAEVCSATFFDPKGERLHA